MMDSASNNFEYSPSFVGLTDQYSNVQGVDHDSPVFTISGHDQETSEKGRVGGYVDPFTKRRERLFGVNVDLTWTPLTTEDKIKGATLAIVPVVFFCVAVILTSMYAP